MHVNPGDPGHREPQALAPDADTQNCWPLPRTPLNTPVHCIVTIITILSTRIIDLSFLKQWTNGNASSQYLQTPEEKWYFRNSRAYEYRLFPNESQILGSEQKKSGLGRNVYLAKVSCLLLEKPTRAMKTQPRVARRCLLLADGGCPEAMECRAPSISPSPVATPRLSAGNTAFPLSCQPFLNQSVSNFLITIDVICGRPPSLSLRVSDLAGNNPFFSFPNNFLATFLPIKPLLAGWNAARHLIIWNQLSQ